MEATYYGLHRFDGRLPNGGTADAEARGRLLAGLAADLEDLADGSLDLQIARRYVELGRFEHDEVGLWARMADAPDTIGTALFLTFARDFAPLEERLESIAERLEDVPRYLAASRERLTDPVRLWATIAAETARQLPELFEVIVASASAGTLKNRLEAAAGPATQAARDFASWLEGPVADRAGDDWAIGAARFERLLELRRLPDAPGVILALGRSYLESAKWERQELLAEHWPGQSVEAVNALVRSQHAATFEAALEGYRETIRGSRGFVVEHGLATIPGGEELRVEETPTFLRPVIPFAAYEPPAYFDRHQLGIYIVTRQAGDLTEHNRPSVLNTSVHEGYPGHHLQFACASRNPSLIRLLDLEHSTELVEGWAHYCEELMYEQGFSTGPEVRFVQLNDQIWRACRIVIDVELSSGRMGFEEAVAMLTGEAAMTRAGAESEVRRYTYTPGYQLSYLYGKHLLLRLRERRRAAEGAAFDLRRFHDTLLGSGAVPAAYWDRLF